VQEENFLSIDILLVFKTKKWRQAKNNMVFKKMIPDFSASHTILLANKLFNAIKGSVKSDLTPV
jgi:hypothetical protein